MITLFLSFTNLLALVSRVRIADEDLMKGLYYFGCTREHVMNPWTDKDHEVLWFNHADFAELVRKRITTVITKAEYEGRIIYRPRGEDRTFDQLDELLVKNGLNKLAFPGNEEDAETWRYGGWSSFVAEEATKRANPGLTIMGS